MWEIFGTQNSPFVTIHTITNQRKTSLLFTWCDAWSPKNLGTRYRLPLVFTDNRYHHELSILQLLTLTKIAYVTYLSRVANNNFPERFCCGKKAFLKQKKKFLNEYCHWWWATATKAREILPEIPSKYYLTNKVTFYLTDHVERGKWERSRFK